MDKETKRKIEELVLELRESFEDDITVVLGRYGIFVGKKWTQANNLTYLSDDEKELKDRIEKIIRKEMESGIKQDEATKAYIRNTSYTHINRLIGLRCMEARGFIEETIKTRDVYSGRSLRHRNFLHEHPEYSSDPEDGLVPFVEEVCKEITKEIKILFDPESETSLVWPRYRTLKDAIALINELDDSAWKTDDVLGWVYQYFNSKEKDKVFEEVKKKKKKIKGHDIIPATQMYTEKYMVRFLVENSLGALWQEMYPDSKLHETWEYFVPDPNKTTRDPKPVKDITFLDPACGSGHFLLVAFNIFYQMYIEEGIVSEKEIPHYILTYNLHGIDIDRRAIQLSALNLYLKAKQYQSDFSMKTRNTIMNLVVADAVLMDDNKLDKFLIEVGGSKKLREVVKTIWNGMQNVREIGSLLKVEEQIDALIESEVSSDGNQLAITNVGDLTRQNWEKLKKQMLEKFHDYYEKASQVFDVNRQLFANEAIKGVQLLDLLERRYDVVATNPPYMGRRKMAKRFADEAKRLYPNTSRDLYTMFIERCLDLCFNPGMTALVSLHTFMFITSFQELRKHILSESRIRTLCHLGAGTMKDLSNPNAAGFVIYVLRRCETDQSHSKLGIYQRLVEVKDKRKGLTEGPPTFIVDPDTFKVIEGYPIVYWIPDKIKRAFENFDTLAKYADLKTGLATANNERFLRFFWEVNENEIADVHNKEGKKWFPYAKGGPLCKWYGNLDIVVNWGNNGQEIKNFERSVIRNQEYYFREGVTYTLVSSKGFSARFLPENSIFDVGGSSVFPKDVSIHYLLGFLNSILVKFVLGLLNPTVNFQVGDLSRLPFKYPPAADSQIEEHVKNCIRIKKEFLKFTINDREFSCTVFDWAKSQQSDTHGFDSLFRFYLNHKESELVKLYIYEGLIDQEIFDLYEIDGDDLQQILDEQGIPAGWYPLVEGFELIPDDLLPEAKTKLENHEQKSFSGDELNELTFRLQELYEEGGKSIEEISIELEIHPASVVALRQELDLVNPDELKDEVENFLTHRILESLKADSDGIIPLQKIGVEENMLTRLRSALEETFGTDQAFTIEDEMRDILGESLEKWLETDFFKKHIKQYKKRPIVWHVQSPDKNFACYVYYHKLNNDALPKIRTNYLWRALDSAKQKLSTSKKQLALFEQTGDKAVRKQRKEIENIEECIADLQKLDSRLEKVISAGYNPEIDDGVKVNITPLQEAKMLSVKKVV